MPVMHHWVVLAARLWTKLAAIQLDQPSMAKEAWLSERNGWSHVHQVLVEGVASCILCSRLVRSLRPTEMPLRTLQLCSLKRATLKAAWQPACMLGGHWFCWVTLAWLHLRGWKRLCTQTGVRCEP